MPYSDLTARELSVLVGHAAERLKTADGSMAEMGFRRECAERLRDLVAAYLASLSTK